MDITAIDSKTYDEMLRVFSDLTNDIKKLCRSARASHDWLDNQDLCQILDVKKRTLQYYRDSRILGFTQIGHKCYYRKEDVQALINKSTTNKT